MGTVGFGESFAPIAQYEKQDIHPVFPHFSYCRLGQNPSPDFLAPLYGAAFIISAISLESVAAHSGSIANYYEACRIP